MDIKNELVKVGIISTSHGIKGELKFKIIDKFIDNNQWDNAVIFIEISNSQTLPGVIEKSFYKNQHLIIKLKGFDSINEIQDFLGKNVWFKWDESLVSKVKTNLGFKVEFENNQIGEIIEELNNGAQKILRVKYFSDQKDLLVPLVDRYLVEINEELESVIMKNLKELM
ncbi:hypothetical protein [Spiroplasma endosymbiont of Panorpa germanica]|uniref:ribosome maturation factor RimM n=1 Tax=Spiroplasma endosymbiont of Panorpa germanica TaxID=3066314 RepID=UPI0030CBDF28